MQVPILTTPRLRLRPHRMDDLDACVELWQDPVVTRYTSGRPLARQDVWTRLLRHPGHWALLGFGYWVAEERTSGRFVGEVGLGRFKRDLLIRIPFVSPTTRNFTGLPAPRPEPVLLLLASARIERALQPIQSESV